MSVITSVWQSLLSQLLPNKGLRGGAWCVFLLHAQCILRNETGSRATDLGRPGGFFLPAACVASAFGGCLHLNHSKGIAELRVTGNVLLPFLSSGGFLDRQERTHAKIACRFSRDSVGKLLLGECYRQSTWLHHPTCSHSIGIQVGLVGQQLGPAW